MITIFDIDNCVADDFHRRHLIDMGESDIDKRYHAYHEQMHLDKACNHDCVNKHIEAGVKIVFVTGRPELYRQLTWSWLLQNFNLLSDTQLLMRPNGDHRPSGELKPWLVRNHIPNLNEIFCAYDDLYSVLDGYAEIGIINVKRLCAAQEPLANSILQQAAETFKQRNALYGDSYKLHGKVMAALFPNGLELDTVEEWNRFGVFSMMVSKMTRYAANMKTGGHKDSAHDMCVYAAMLEELTK